MVEQVPAGLKVSGGERLQQVVMPSDRVVRIMHKKDTLLYIGWTLDGRL